MTRNAAGVWLLAAIAGLATPVVSIAQQSVYPRDKEMPFWLGIGVGGAAVNSLAPAPSADREAMAASIEFGYRPTPDWGVGLEYGGVLPFEGCAQWDCGESRADFAPNFTRFFAFGEYRPRDSGLRLRAGFGVSRFCYARYWSEDAWSWGDIIHLMIDDDYLEYGEGGSGAWRCEASRQALGGSVSLGYDWPLADNTASMGVRLTAEAANFARTPGTDLPSFRHRAVLFTVHFNLQ
jgi:hypothetical protein